MKGNFYKSCNCWICRQVSNVKSKLHKKSAHKKFRKQGKQDPENIVPVSTGYKA